MNIKKIKPFFVDERGAIARILDFKGKITSALFITSKKGAVRANHYHENDIHYVYLLTGEFRYYEKGLGSNGKLTSKIIKPGDLVKTPAKVIHAMEFSKDSTIFVLTSEPRSQKKYETDTKRVKLI